ncbi:Penicillin-binding protein F [Hartmannibacter diazotrophicus]|uniref:peptidoglycan glycosyltransferase n=1 Tax=Hartmannibacter diazotrophicus TaxID=1482074 RepID=A0A2C9D850_9HYPH|nr:penicillin-binding protein 1C [Hartmannibacter diazotrophicus]SON56308.1 Penicillin-binding protein F [Hartmannibacter diazotrophicus]
MRRLTLALLLIAGLAPATAAVGLREVVADTRPPDLGVATSQQVLDRNGRLLRPFTVADGLWRLPVSASEVDPLYLKMLLAYEDKGFHAHHGVEVTALMRAAGQMLTSGRIVSGGSTLTMQVARLADRLATRNAQGKGRQILSALALERHFSKQQILDAYVQLAPFGGNLEGVRAATLAWFGKEPTRLTPAECALLVALPQSPEGRRPDRDPKAAKAARDRVLARAVEAGVIDEDDAVAARREPIPTVRRDFPLLAPQLAAREAKASPDIGSIRLTIDREDQDRLEQLARARAKAIGPDVSVAILVADRTNGEVLAQVGSAGLFETLRDGFVDMSEALRSPGSTLKPFIYGLAFDAGIAHPETLIEDRPTGFAGYVPTNFDKEFHGTVTIRRALQLSLNVPAVEVLESVGPARLMARMRRAGVRPALTDLSPPGLAIGLGGLGLRLSDLVTLYVALARGGEPIPLVHRPDEQVGPLTGGPVMGRRSAAYITDILAGGPTITKTDSRVAIKTGTSYGYRDAWALGYDGRHVIGVWVGRPDGEPVPGLVGYDVAVPILKDAFVRIGGAVPLPAPPPDLLKVSSVELPPPLQHFGSAARGGGVKTQGAGLEIAYPPNGARVDLMLPGGHTAPLPLKVRGGHAPYTWFVDGAPVVRDPYGQPASFAPSGAGFMTIAVVDGDGRSDRVRIFVENPPTQP